jgi:hypothetical protein
MTHLETIPRHMLHVLPSFLSTFWCSLYVNSLVQGIFINRLLFQCSVDTSNSTFWVCVFCCVFWIPEFRLKPTQIDLVELTVLISCQVLFSMMSCGLLEVDPSGNNDTMEIGQWLQMWAISSPGYWLLNISWHAIRCRGLIQRRDTY